MFADCFLTSAYRAQPARRPSAQFRRCKPVIGAAPTAGEALAAAFGRSDPDATVLDWLNARLGRDCLELQPLWPDALAEPLSGPFSEAGAPVVIDRRHRQFARLGVWPIAGGE